MEGGGRGGGEGEEGDRVNLDNTDDESTVIFQRGNGAERTKQESISYQASSPDEVCLHSNP